MKAISPSHLELLKALNLYKIDFLIRGGYAVNNRAYSRYTEDESRIDFSKKPS